MVRLRVEGSSPSNGTEVYKPKKSTPKKKKHPAPSAPLKAHRPTGGVSTTARKSKPKVAVGAHSSGGDKGPKPNVAVGAHSSGGNKGPKPNVAVGAHSSGGDKGQPKNISTPKAEVKAEIMNGLSQAQKQQLINEANGKMKGSMTNAMSQAQQQQSINKANEKMKGSMTNAMSQFKKSTPPATSNKTQWKAVNDSIKPGIMDGKPWKTSPKPPTPKPGIMDGTPWKTVPKPVKPKPGIMDGTPWKTIPRPTPPTPKPGIMDGKPWKTTHDNLASTSGTYKKLKGAVSSLTKK
jgi:hypothetical protein